MRSGRTEVVVAVPDLPIRFEQHRRSLHQPDELQRRGRRTGRIRRGSAPVVETKEGRVHLLRLVFDQASRLQGEVLLFMLGIEGVDLLRIAATLIFFPAEFTSHDMVPLWPGVVKRGLVLGFSERVLMRVL